MPTASFTLSAPSASLQREIGSTVQDYADAKTAVVEEIIAQARRENGRKKS